MYALYVVYKKYFNRKKIINYISDYGIFWESLHSEFSVQQESFDVNTDLRVDDPSFPVFFQYSLCFTNINDIYFRKFLKLHSSFGNLGIILKLIFYIGKLFSNYFGTKLFYYEIYNKIFSKYNNDIELKKNWEFRFSMDNIRAKKYFFKIFKSNYRENINITNSITKIKIIPNKIDKLKKFDYFLPFFQFKKIKRLEFLSKFISILVKYLSLEILLENILKFETLGNNLEELKIIEFNKIKDIDIFKEDNCSKKISKFSNFTLNNSNLMIFDEKCNKLENEQK